VINHKARGCDGTLTGIEDIGYYSWRKWNSDKIV